MPPETITAAGLLLRSVGVGTAVVGSGRPPPSFGGGWGWVPRGSGRDGRGRGGGAWGGPSVLVKAVVGVAAVVLPCAGLAGCGSAGGEPGALPVPTFRAPAETATANGAP